MPPRHLLLVDGEDHIREIASLCLETERDWTLTNTMNSMQDFEACVAQLIRGVTPHPEESQHAA